MTKGVYCYIDKKDNQIVYVGKDSNIDTNERHKQHFQPSKYDKQPINRILQNNPDRYIHQLLWEIDDCTNNHLNQMEIYYIKKYDPQFNFTEGGDGTTGYKHSEESRKKMSENNARYWQGKTLSEETRKKMSESCKGKKLSEETRKKMSESRKGENNPMYGKRHSEETRKKMSESRSKAQNTTGFYRVSKQKNDCKQGFTWCYQYQYKSTRKVISSTNLKKLEEKVRKEGLEWKVIDKENSIKSIRENNNHRFN